MKELTRQQYLENIYDFEKLYLIVTESDKIYLRADIENEENLRIEMFYLELNTSLKFFDAEQEARQDYCGKIYFIEYDSNEIAEKNILTDFLELAYDAIFLLYKNDNLKKILATYPNKYIFLRIGQNFYNLHNRDSFENYLLNNTRLETSSGGKHNFGKIYAEGSRRFINLNLQIRFI